ncbi:4-coumarate-CoA ligase [Xylariaceae sp. FL1651]|nr:4-coumarate-CoA ligase [Xylariaceae sp. FL1651]
MLFKSLYLSLELLKSNVLSYLFPKDEEKYDELLLHRKTGIVAIIIAPNHMFVPVAFLGIVCAGFCISAANPAYVLTVNAVLKLVQQIRHTTTKLILVHPDHTITVLAEASNVGFPKSRVFSFPMIPTSLGRLSSIQSRDTIATINYSSGINGLLKGVYGLQANLIANLCTMLMDTKLLIPIYVITEFRYEEFLFNIGQYRRPETARYNNILSLKMVRCCRTLILYKIQIYQGWGMIEVTCGVMHVPFGFKDNSRSVGQLDPNHKCKLVGDEGNKELIEVNVLQVAPAELEGVPLEQSHIADAAAAVPKLYSGKIQRMTMRE